MSRTGFVVRAEPAVLLKMDDEQLQRVDEALREGAQAHGFGRSTACGRGDRTSERRSLSGSRWWKILTAMQRELQLPGAAGAGTELGGTAALVAEQWPAVKKRPASKSLDSVPGRKWRLEVALLVRRTWAPKGETPASIHAFNWKKLSVCAEGLSHAAVVPDQARQLQRREPDRLLARPEETPAWAEGDPDLGRVRRTQESQDETVPGESAHL